MERLPSSGRGRAICAYRGNLVPGYLHTVRVEHLRPIPGEQYKPFKADAFKTHHLWILYRPLSGGSVQVLCSQQFNFAVFNVDAGTTLDLWQLPDRIAQKVGKFLATNVMPGAVSDLQDPRFLRRIPDKRLEIEFAPIRELFYAEAVSRCCEQFREN